MYESHTPPPRSPSAAVVALLVVAAALATVSGCGREVDFVDTSCLADLDCATGENCFEGTCVAANDGIRVCADDNGCRSGEVCESGLCVDGGGGGPVDGACSATADCAINAFCNTGAGTCQALLEEWCRTDSHCGTAPATPWCSNRVQGSTVVGRCVECVDDGDCEGQEACTFGACLGDNACPQHATPAPGGICLCDDGYIDDGRDGCIPADGSVGPVPDGCAPLNVTCGDFGYGAGAIVRSADCLRLDISGCHDVCGDGDVGPTEQCDGTVIPFQCTDFGFLAGPLTCHPTTCVVNASACTTPVCGDGVIEAGEACEPDDLGDRTCADVGFTRGDLSCATDCRTLNTTACVFGDESEPNNTAATADPFQAPFVGRIEVAGDIDCFTVDAAIGDTILADVVAVGSDSLGSCGADTTLTLSTTAGAQLAFDDDFSGLCSRIEHTVAVAGPYALCVRAFGGSATFPYRVLTSVRSPVCGDGRVEAAEQCDGTALAGATCATRGALAGPLSCNVDCTFNVDACIPADEVEPNNSPVTANPFQPGFLGQIQPAGDTDCMQIEAGVGDVVRADIVGADDNTLGSCSADTTLTMFDSSGVQVAFNDDSNGRCSHLDVTVAVADTYALCVKGFSTTAVFTWRLNAETITPVCGDAVGEGLEVCDGSDARGDDCSDYGAIDGTLGCAGDCTAVDTTLCRFPVCGDGRVEGPEVCDGTLGLGGNCFARGFTGGVVGCATDCSAVDLGGCVTELDEVEPNNTGAAANPAATDFVGRVTAGDVDCVQVPGTAGQPLTLDLVNLETGATGSCGVDSTLTLFDQNGTSQLDFDDDTFGVCPRISFPVTVSGTYSVCVRGFSNTTTFLYRLLTR